MSENTERRYLKWYNKVGYGSGDVAGNVVYAFLSSFVMIYLTDTVGLNPGIVGTLIAVSKLFDGITDIFFGSMIDKTHSKLGKARPWMLYGYIGCAITLVGIVNVSDIGGPVVSSTCFIIAALSATTQNRIVGARKIFKSCRGRLGIFVICFYVGIRGSRTTVGVCTR